MEADPGAELTSPLMLPLALTGSPSPAHGRSWHQRGARATLLLISALLQDPHISWSPASTPLAGLEEAPSCSLDSVEDGGGPQAGVRGQGGESWDAGARLGSLAGGKVKGLGGHLGGSMWSGHPAPTSHPCSPEAQDPGSASEGLGLSH